MNKGLKYTLIGLTIAGAGVGLYFLLRDKNKDEEKLPLGDVKHNRKITFSRA